MSESDQSIMQLVKSVQSDASKLMKAQTELATTELKGSQQEAAATGGMFAGAAFTGLMGAIFVLVAVAYGIAVFLPVWAGFLIVAVVLLLIAGILAAVGKKRSKSIKGPELAKAEWQRTKQMLSGKRPEVLPVPASTSAVQERAGDVRRATS